MTFISSHLILIVIATIRILLRDNMSPITRLAWFMVIVTLPVIGIIVYFLFGEVNLGKLNHFKHKTLFDGLIRKYRGVLGDPSLLSQNIDKSFRPAFKYASSINHFNLTLGNTAELMPDAKTARSRLVEDIDAAQYEVHVLYYIWLDDHTGTNVAKALIRAAQRGVRCRAMVDGLGSGAFLKSTLWKQMQGAGVETAVALPINHIFYTLLFSRIDLRNHRKITVIDGQITYCGSQNCADPEFAVKAKFAPWVDIMLRVEGPVVAQNQLLFISDWLVQSEADTQEFIMQSQAAATGFPAQIIGDGPTFRRSSTPQLFATLIHQAQSELTISTPYFVPDSTVLNALCAAAHRGVDVTLILPKRNDSWIVAAASRSYYRQLLESGVKLFEFKGGLLHSKTLTLDGCITFLGSSNMDIRSFDLNYENDILLFDKAVSLAVQERQLSYQAQSDVVELEVVKNWPIAKRLWNNAIATMGPVL